MDRLMVGSHHGPFTLPNCWLYFIYWNLQQSINMHKENITHIKAAEKGKPAEEPSIED
jgi:hypothetical protein